MKRLSNENGSILIFATLIIVVLLIMVGLGLDTGQLAYVRSQGQAAVDAAALSAVSGLPFNANQVEKRAAAFNATNDYVEWSTNKIGAPNVSYVKYNFNTNMIEDYYSSIEPGVNGVRVALENATASSGITTPVFLTPLLNLLGLPAPASRDIDVSAVAVIEAKPTIPIALWSGACPASGTQEVQIQMQHPDQKTGDENACWTTFLDCSSGAPDIKAGFEVAETCSGTEKFGTIGIGIEPGICQNRGQVNTVMKTAEDFWKATKDVLPSWLIPVIAGGGNCDPNNPAIIKTWARITPKEFKGTGNPKYIIADVECGDDLINDPESTLCFNHRLVRETKSGM